MGSRTSTFVDSLTTQSKLTASAVDEKTLALVCVAATVSLDAATASVQHAVALALAAGATKEEIVATLEAVTPVTGTSRVVPQQMGGLELARRLSQHAHPPAIVLISPAPSDAILAAAAGADFFLLKAGIKPHGTRTHD